MLARFTVSQLAENLNVTKEGAYALVTFLKSKQVVKAVDKFKAPGAKGAGQDVYEMDLADATIVASDLTVAFEKLRWDPTI